MFGRATITLSIGPHSSYHYVLSIVVVVHCQLSVVTFQNHSHFLLPDCMQAAVVPAYHI